MHNLRTAQPRLLQTETETERQKTTGCAAQNANTKRTGKRIVLQPCACMPNNVALERIRTNNGNRQERNPNQTRRNHATHHVHQGIPQQEEGRIPFFLSNFDVMKNW